MEKYKNNIQINEAPLSNKLLWIGSSLAVTGAAMLAVGFNKNNGLLVNISSAIGVMGSQFLICSAIIKSLDGYEYQGTVQEEPALERKA